MVAISTRYFGKQSRINTIISEEFRGGIDIYEVNTFLSKIFHGEDSDLHYAIQLITYPPDMPLIGASELGRFDLPGKGDLSTQFARAEQAHLKIVEDIEKPREIEHILESMEEYVGTI